MSGSSEAPVLLSKGFNVVSQLERKSLPTLNESKKYLSMTSYQDLLETISELQTNLQKALLLASESKGENLNLREDSQNSNALLKQTQERYRETRTSLIAQMNITIKKENKLDKEKVKWKKEQDRQRKELEDLYLKNTLKGVNMVGAGKIDEVIEKNEMETSHMQKEVRMTDISSF